MGWDISDLLANWPFKHDEVVARRVAGDDGREKLQLRLDLGLMQMEMDGRPDGRKPFGHESYLAFHQHRLEGHRERTGGDEGFALTAKDCEELRREAVQYYHRYVTLSTLGDYERLVRDTGRNLEMADFLWAYAPAEEKWGSEQFRPYLIMMNTRGKVLMSLDAKDYAAALLQIRAGIQALEDFFRKHGNDEAIAQCQEIHALRKWALEVDEQRPQTLGERLRKELAEAVQNEDYERAAEIRDQLKTWEETDADD